MLKSKKLHQLLSTLGQLFIIPSVVFLFTSEHSYMQIIMMLISCYLFSALGFVIMAHRYFTHRAFKLNPTKEKLFSLFTVLGTWLSPAEWTAVHKHHHIHSDTDQDVHSSKVLGWKNLFFYFHRYDVVNQRNFTVAKLLKDPWHKFLMDYKFLIIAIYASTIYYIGGIDLLFYLWIIPTAYSFAAAITIIMNHVNGEPRDSFIQDIFTLGEGYHKQHHENPKLYENSIFTKVGINLIKD